MRRNIIETFVAGLVMVVGLGFLFFVLDNTQAKSFEGYGLYARFGQAPTLRPGADVRIAGVAIGRVTAVELDMQRFDVKVDFLVSTDTQVPSDSEAVLDFDGVFGDAIITLRPGRDSEMLQAGDRVVRTRSPINVVDQLGRYIFGGGVSDDF